MKTYNSRKFLLALAGLIISSALVVIGVISGDNFVMLNSVLGGAYMAANAVASVNRQKMERDNRDEDFNA